MNQAEIRKLIPALRVPIQARKRKMSQPQGPEGRMNMMRATVTQLVKDERIELNYPRADESRGYMERLIAEAIKHGDCHKPTMELADYWLTDKAMVHKLFKVLVPRFKETQRSYTRLHKAPNHYPGNFYDKAVLELRGNPFPPVQPHPVPTRNWIQNILLEEAKREYGIKKRQEMLENEID